jgi:hypothetical protein
VAEFLEERLPVDIRMGASYGDDYTVQIIETSGGAEYRRLVHGVPRRRWTINYTLLRDDLQARVLALYHRAFQSLAGFRVYDTDDHNSSASGRGAITNLDQALTRLSAGIIETASTLTFTGVSNGCAQFTSGYLTSTGVACGSGGGGGGGLTSITAPTGGAQTGPGISFALGTSGTDASIAGSANTITFNFPTASASNRGLLTASDFSMFNSKVAGSIGNTQIGVGSGTSLSGSSALTYNTATGTFAQTLNTNASILHSVTNASTGSAGSVEMGAYTSSGSLRLFATGSGYTPSGLIVANQAQLNAGSGTVDMLFALTDSGASQRQRWAIGGAEQMRLTETGLGIGTTSPSAKLHVYAASANTSGIRTERMTSATTPTGGAAVVGVDGSGNLVVAATSVVADPGANGVMVRTAANTTTARTLTGTANEITIADGTGVSGNPTFSLSSTFDISGKTSTKPMKSGTTAGIPGTCAVGEYYFATDATAGSNTYACTSLNTWTVQAVAGSAGALSAITAARNSPPQAELYELLTNEGIDKKAFLSYYVRRQVMNDVKRRVKSP